MVYNLNNNVIKAIINNSPNAILMKSTLLGLIFGSVAFSVVPLELSTSLHLFSSLFLMLSLFESFKGNLPYLSLEVLI